MYDAHPFDVNTEVHQQPQDEGADSDNGDSVINDEELSYSSSNSNGYSTSDHQSNIDEDVNDDNISFDTSTNDTLHQGVHNNNDNDSINDDHDSHMSNTSTSQSLDVITSKVEEANILPNTGANDTYNLRSREHIAHLYVQSPFDYTNRYGYAAHVMMVQVSAKKGLQLFGEQAAMAIITEFRQLHDKSVFKLVSMQSVLINDQKKALRAITLVQEKRCGKIKVCTN
jgi:hypothetical protein